MEGNSAILLLEDGTIFNGKSIGKIGTSIGEICFNTGMTGYQEIFTDPSYFGQILIATNVHIGNYGIHNRERESESIQIAGFVCRNFSNKYSRQSAHKGIQEYFEEENLIGIADVDTRKLVRHIREKGAMNGLISSEISNIKELEKILAKAPSMEGLELSSKVTTKQSYFLGDPHARFRVAVLDFGTKKNILRSLLNRNCYLKVFPANTSYQELSNWDADGYFMTNGPGDPAAMPYAIKTIKYIIASKKPVFGICLGHQLMALATGLKTYKMHHGHRGINHPVKNLLTGKCEITSQNHGFAVEDNKKLLQKNGLSVTHINLNDDTIEGLVSDNKLAYSVQFHPEASPGPHDSHYLFNEFLEMMQKTKAKVII